MTWSRTTFESSQTKEEEGVSASGLVTSENQAMIFACKCLEVNSTCYPEFQ